MDHYVESELLTRAVCDSDGKTALVPLMKQIIGIADRVRRNGLLDLDDVLPEVEDEVLRLGLQLVLDGMEPGDIRRILNTRLLTSGCSGAVLLKGVVGLTAALMIQAGQNLRYMEVELAALAGKDYQRVLTAIRS